MLLMFIYLFTSMKLKPIYQRPFQVPEVMITPLLNIDIIREMVNFEIILI